MAILKISLDLINFLQNLYYYKIFFTVSISEWHYFFEKLARFSVTNGSFMGKVPLKLLMGRN